MVEPREGSLMELFGGGETPMTPAPTKLNWGEALMGILGTVLTKDPTLLYKMQAYKENAAMDEMKRQWLQMQMNAKEKPPTDISTLLKPQTETVSYPIYDEGEPSQVTTERKTGGFIPSGKPITKEEMPQVKNYMDIFGPQKETFHNVPSGTTVLGATGKEVFKTPEKETELKPGDYQYWISEEDGDIVPIPKNTKPPKGYILYKGEESRILPTAGNATDLAIMRKFKTVKVLKDQKLRDSMEVDKWLDSSEGRNAVVQARDDLTPPTVTPVITDKGIDVLHTRGKGMGTMKPTGKLPPMSEDLKKDYTATAQAYDMVNNLKSLWDSFEHGSGSSGRIKAAETYASAVAGQHPDAKVYVANREAFLGNLSRSLAAERGVLTQQDIERIAMALPKIGLNALSNDNKEEADKKWAQIEKIISNAEKRLGERAEMRKGEMKPIVKGKEETRKVIRTGTEKGTGKRVIEYDDGSTEYAK